MLLLLFSMPWDDDVITPKILLEHILAMRQAMDGRFEGIEGRLNGVEGRLEGVEGRLNGVEGTLSGVVGRLDVMGKDIRNINVSFQRLYSHRVNMLGRIEKLEETVGVGQ